jgi:hypothetical protein
MKRRRRRPLHVPDPAARSATVSQLFETCNDGVDPLTVGNPAGLVGGAAFAQIGTAPAASVAPGTCTELRVRFHVGAAGTYTGTVSIINDDGDENPFNLTLKGTAVP